MLSGLKDSTKMQNRESLFKYQSCVYSFQRKSYINHKVMEIRWNNKLFS